jgi:uncharacterized small protein (DUF1192 family)
MRGEFVTDFAINVLLFGQRGNGKSATTNTLLSCLSLDEVPIKLVEERKTSVTEHTTANFQKLWIGDILAESSKVKDNPDLVAKRSQLQNQFDIKTQEFDNLELDILSNPSLEERHARVKKEVDVLKAQLEKIESIIKSQAETFHKKFSEDCRKVKLHFFDPWGTTPENYVGTTLAHILRGQLDPGAEMNEVYKYTQPHPINHNRIHVILLVFPLTMIQIGAKTQELVKLVSECSKAENGGYDPILVVTHIDDFEDQQGRQPFIDKIRDNFPNITIFFHQNYTQQHNRVIDIDLSSRLILNSIVHKAKTWKAVHKNYFDGVNWKFETVLNQNAKEGYCHNPSCNCKIVQKGQHCTSCKSELKPQPFHQHINPNQIEKPINTVKGPICVTKECVKFGKVVEGKFCQDCGQPPQIPAPPVSSGQLVCIKLDCTNYGKPVGKFCSECGGVGQALAQKTCRKSDCVNFGKVVSSKFCSECGTAPSSAPSVPMCKTSGCVNLGTEIKGKFCPECGKPPST